MKFAIFVVFCAVTVFVSADQASKTQIGKFMEECADLTGIDKGNLEGHFKADAKKPTKVEENCFKTYMMTKLGYLDEFGNINEQLIHKNSRPGKFEEDKQKVKNVYEKCKITRSKKSHNQYDN